MSMQYIPKDTQILKQKEKRIFVGKALHKILSSLAYIIAIEELFSDSSGTRGKERDFCAKPSSLDKTFLRILDPKIPCFVDSD